MQTFLSTVNLFFKKILKTYEKCAASLFNAGREQSTPLNMTTRDFYAINTTIVGKQIFLGSILPLFRRADGGGVVEL
ncbi:MAG: hypothetical protein A2Y14_03875 [Verrucomicrobia bacterium GWF2_51_19]|nr:MAG: hypothetical protein A2Y14_03875 [Verrucomicrobia bacterium GWF2_51_19]